ncbi:hypothetical protein SRABI106_03342 [Rahnella aquatilis]|nr:hypothetical protein SRABI106_03342 [Rahnella aquatilis]
MGGRSDAHLLFQHQQDFSRFLLFTLESFQPCFTVLNAQIGDLAQIARTLNGLQRLLILNRTGLLNIQRLLVIGQLAFQLIHFQFSGFSARFMFSVQLAGFSHHFVLFFETIRQLFEITFITLDFFLLTHCRLNQTQMIAGSLIIGF